MASFGGIDLGREGAGVFELTTESDDEMFAYRFADGILAIIPPSSKFVVVSQCPGAEFGMTHVNARTAANRAMDVYYSQGGRPLLIAHKDKPYIVCWNTSAGQTLRIVGRSQTTSRLRARSVAYTHGGNLIESSSPLPDVWHESLRYYRISESSADLYDSFRNLYLSLESLLSYVVPPESTVDGRPEGDSAWLKRALNVVGRAVDLIQYGPTSPQTPSNAIHKELYINLRTAIFHSKTGRATWTPQDWASRSVIVEARLRYARMFRALAAEYLKTSYLNGGLVQAAAEEILENVFKDNVVFVSNDQTKLEREKPGENQIWPAGGDFLTFPTVPANDMATDWCRGVKGVGPASTVHDTLGEIRRFGAVHGEEPRMIENLRAPLIVNEIHELQVVLLIEWRDYGSPRQDFES